VEKIVHELPLAQATVSQHIKELKQVGIICGNIEGSSICYCIEKSFLNQFKEFFQTIEDKINNVTLNCC